MSSLQCPSTLILTRPVGVDGEGVAGIVDRLRDRRTGHVWSSDLPDAESTAQRSAARLGVAHTSRHDLRERSPGEADLEVVQRVRGALGEIADLHPGETVLVVTHPGVVALVVPKVCRMDVAPHRLGPGALIEIEIDAEDWVCRRWETTGSAQDDPR